MALTRPLSHLDNLINKITKNKITESIVVDGAAHDLWNSQIINAHWWFFNDIFHNRSDHWWLLEYRRGPQDMYTNPHSFRLNLSQRIFDYTQILVDGCIVLTLWELFLQADIIYVFDIISNK